MTSEGQVLMAADAVVTNEESGTTVTKIVNGPDGSDSITGIYRISTPVPPMPPALPDGFTFNQFLLVDDKPLLFHTGMKSIFPLVKQAVESIIPASSVRYIAFSHFETDESGAMNEWLETAPEAEIICSHVEAMTNAGDAFNRKPSPMGDNQELSTGVFNMRWLDMPQCVHGWGNGVMFETTTKTLFCGDFITQVGNKMEPVQEACSVEDIKLKLFDLQDYWPWTSKSKQQVERLAGLEPAVLLCMHGSAFAGPHCGEMLRELGALRASLDVATTA